ncbi:uncharacterized protein LOC119662578 [Teleopsis dalmanni]|uniref:uncharacterized protein LOC119662578 n=1 Tax=Teleopsis dalmanni TaxID=139649 RepID=UPI000D32C225|nr:uncharacterized protein LOC119662578 [Teleopsis dalmanni]
MANGKRCLAQFEINGLLHDGQFMSYVLELAAICNVNGFINQDFDKKKFVGKVEGTYDNVEKFKITLRHQINQNVLKVIFGEIVETSVAHYQTFQVGKHEELERLPEHFHRLKI